MRSAILKLDVYRPGDTLAEAARYNVAVIVGSHHGLGLTINLYLDGVPVHVGSGCLIAFVKKEEELWRLIMDLESTRLYLIQHMGFIALRS